MHYECKNEHCKNEAKAKGGYCAGCLNAVLGKEPQLRIYVASSWRNERQPSVVKGLRAQGHEVYDFREPAPGNYGFSWSEVDERWKDWEARDLIRGLGHSAARAGFRLDMDALNRADACVLVTPCGVSAHLELGHAAGRKIFTAVFFPDGELAQAELMYSMCDLLTDSEDELAAGLRLYRRLKVR